jgi:hypothetical protein
MPQKIQNGDAAGRKRFAKWQREKKGDKRLLDVQQFLRRVLSYYHNSFDITAPYELDGTQHAALAAMHAHEDQYVRFVGTTLWNADSHEFTLFDTFDTAPTAEQVQALIRTATDTMEPKFVRGGEALPPKDHQYTWLSLVLLSQHTPDAAARQAVERCKSTKFYQFYLRGYSEVRVILVDLETGTLTTNKAGRSLKKMYKFALDKARKAEQNTAN